MALYARVSGHDQKQDLERQLARLRTCSRTFGLPVVREIKEVGSGLNGHRKKLASPLADTDVTTIVVEHRDRLMRFGTDYIEAAMAASGWRLIVVNDGEMKDDLVVRDAATTQSAAADCVGHLGRGLTEKGRFAGCMFRCSSPPRLTRFRVAMPMTGAWPKGCVPADTRSRLSSSTAASRSATTTRAIPPAPHGTASPS